MDWIKLQYALYIAGSLCFLAGSAIGLAKHILNSQEVVVCDYDGKADAEYGDYCTDKFLDEMEELREENAALRAEVERLREDNEMYRKAMLAVRRAAQEEE